MDQEQLPRAGTDPSSISWPEQFERFPWVGLRRHARKNHKIQDLRHDGEKAIGWLNLMLCADRYDGFLPPFELLIEELPRWMSEDFTMTLIAELIGARLIDEVEGGHFRMHDWREHQPGNVADLEKQRSDAARRQALWRQRHPEKAAQHNAERAANRDIQRKPAASEGVPSNPVAGQPAPKQPGRTTGEPAASSVTNDRNAAVTPYKEEEKKKRERNPPTPFPTATERDKAECREHFKQQWPGKVNLDALYFAFENRWGKPAPTEASTPEEKLHCGIPDKTYYLSEIVPALEALRSEDDSQGRYVMEGSKWLDGDHKPESLHVGCKWLDILVKQKKQVPQYGQVPDYNPDSEEYKRQQARNAEEDRIAREKASAERAVLLERRKQKREREVA